MRFLLSFVFVILFISIMGIGSVYYHQDNTQNIYELTDTLNFNNSLFLEDVVHNVSNTNLSYAEVNHVRLNNIILYTLDGGVKVLFEISKFGIEFGFNNPNYDFPWMVRALTYFVMFMVVGMFIRITITAIPLLIAIGYGIFLLYQKIKGKFKKKNKRGKENGNSI